MNFLCCFSLPRTHHQFCVMSIPKRNSRTFSQNLPSTPAISNHWLIATLKWTMHITKSRWPVIMVNRWPLAKKKSNWLAIPLLAFVALSSHTRAGKRTCGLPQFFAAAVAILVIAGDVVGGILSHMNIKKRISSSANTSEPPSTTTNSSASAYSSSQLQSSELLALPLSALRITRCPIDKLFCVLPGCQQRDESSDGFFLGHFQSGLEYHCTL